MNERNILLKLVGGYLVKQYRELEYEWIYLFYSNNKYVIFVFQHK